jgi:hypothetical protein
MNMELAVVRAENAQLRRVVEAGTLENITLRNQLVLLSRVVSALALRDGGRGHGAGDPSTTMIFAHELRAAEDACLFRFTVEPAIGIDKDVYDLKVQLQMATPDDTARLAEVRRQNASALSIEAQNRPRLEIVPG